MKRDTRHSEKRMKVGVIGIGMLGKAVAVHLLKTKLINLTVYNRTSAKSADLTGAHIATSPMDVAKRTDIIITVVKDAKAVHDISFGYKGIAEGAHEGLIVADMSTIDPTESAKMTAMFAKYGIEKIDIPVMGGPNVAISGDLTMMVSGDTIAYNRCREVLDIIASKIFFLGDSGGNAHLVKLAMNLQITMLALALSEGITFVKRSGLDPKKFLEVLNATYFKTGMSEKKAYDIMIADQMQNSTFTLANLKKDISTITHFADSMGISLPMTRKAEQVYADAVKSGLGQIDYTGIIRYIEKLDNNTTQNQQQL